ncbi:TolC family protein [Psychromonas sp. KJ10-10]|uniref:TolC family protein n=1 Tax=Psychromonas sp. KJ10-10 TaxID=3391823 RepID=UPI0039B3DEC8
MNQLIEVALNDNFSIKVAQTRVARAIASLNIEGARRYPTMTGELTPSYNYDSDKRTSETSNEVELKASWEMRSVGEKPTQYRYRLF